MVNVDDRRVRTSGTGAPAYGVEDWSNPSLLLGVQINLLGGHGTPEFCNGNTGGHIRNNVFVYRIAYARHSMGIVTDLRSMDIHRT